jgi:hypothetical protein
MRTFGFLVIALGIPGPLGAQSAADSAAIRRAALAPQAPASPVDDLLEARVPRAVAGEPRWRYQQRASADLDGDGARETAVLIADVELDARGQPIWEHGHRWQVYVEERDGTRTYVYARFLPNGKLEADLARPDSGAPPTIVLLEQTPYALGVYEVRYLGPGRATIVGRFERRFEQGGWFIGSPRSSRRSRQKLPPRVPPAAAEPSAEPALRARADSVAAQLVAGINRSDAALVAALASHAGEQPYVAAAREAIDDFRYHFRGESVAKSAFVREHWGGTQPRAVHFAYELITEGGVRKPVVAYYEARTDRFRVYDEFLSYSAHARSLVRGVVEALRARDAVRLARLLSPDDIDYPVRLAEQVIANYARRFDLETLRYRFGGLGPERPGDYRRPRVNRWFRYTLYGSKGASPVEHRVELIHGDGLVAWRDSLVPPPSD